MKITLAQINPHIGNFRENTGKMAGIIQAAEKEGSDLVVFPELSVCGYPPLDLLERKEFIDDCFREVEKLARLCLHTGVIVGAPVHNPAQAGKNLFNAAIFLYQGKIHQVVHKTLLPTYDIFDEYRYFEPNREFRTVQFKNKRIALTICEDLWDDQPVEQVFGKNRLYPVSPMDQLSALSPDLIINIAASPFSFRKMEAKKEIFTTRARRYGIPVFYVNQTGAQTELIFEGASKAISKTGKIIKELAWFTEDHFSILFEEEKTSGADLSVETKDPIPLIHDALVLGIRDYFRKNGLSKAILGLSGGIDSAVSLVLAVRALGSANLRVLMMPSMFSSVESVKDAEKLAENLGVRYDLMPITKAYRQFEKMLDPAFQCRDPGITEENIQARIRAVLLMAMANKFGHVLLNTSNKSEAAVGYGTLYGDMCGGLSVIGDVYKTDVYRLAEFINRSGEIIPAGSISKPPSAELKPGQKDTDSLPPYEILDPILYRFIELQYPPGQIIQEGFDAKTVYRVINMISQSEHKRYQAPPILRISSKAFGYGRRIPLTARYKWHG